MIILQKENDLMHLEKFLFEVDEKGVAVLTINRPKKLNALNTSAFVELGDVIAHCNQSSSVRVLILTGAGARVFIAGADINEVSGSADASEAMRFIELGNDMIRALELLGKPVIAAVNGLALGGGAEIAAACDIRFCSENAMFGTPEVGLGLIPGWGGTQRLSRLVGMGLAKEIILSGEPITAQRAYEIGLVNKIFPQQSLLDESKKYARILADNAPFAMKMAKYAINYGYDLPLDNARKLEVQCATQCRNTEDSKEGIAAFLEKRAPSFSKK